GKDSQAALACLSIRHVSMTTGRCWVFRCSSGCRLWGEDGKDSQAALACLSIRHVSMTTGRCWVFRCSSGCR
ncbi:hypothetical protein C7E18_24270, partial [Stenotrophomonas maltophilia]